MKTLKKYVTRSAFFFALITLLVCTSCGGAGNDLKPEQNYTIITIDSCEYIFINRRPWGSEMALTHKGNCKYCIERSRKSAN